MRRAQPKFSDVAIETALTFRIVFRLPLRQAEGFLRSVLRIMGLDLESPDHTTLSRRGQSLALDLRAVPHQGPVHLLIDSSGLAAFGEGEWAAAKHGAKGRRGWRKLHLSVDSRGMILAKRLTEATTDDATTALDLIATITGKIASVTADGAYDTAWKKEAGHHQQARVENAFLRYKTIIGDRLRARSEPGRRVEARIACDILNRMAELERPESIAIGA